MGGNRNYGYGKQLAWAGKNALSDRYGQGLYARARASLVTGKPTIAVPGGFKVASRAALNRLGYKWEPSDFEKDYNNGETTQLAANADVVVQGRLNRKIAFGNQFLQYQTKSDLG